MPLPNRTDPKVTAFLQECNEKEAESRLKWRGKHSELFEKAATFRGEQKNYTHEDINYALAAMGMAATRRDHIAAARHRLRTTKDIHIPITDKKETDKDDLRKMFPVNPEDESLRTEEGRKAYLKKRNELSPEEKYVFPETTSWMYGWRLEDTEMKLKTTRYPRLGVMKTALYSNVGPQPDPSHYANPNNRVSFCSRFT